MTGEGGGGRTGRHAAGRAPEAPPPVLVQRPGPPDLVQVPGSPESPGSADLGPPPPLRPPLIVRRLVFIVVLVIVAASVVVTVLVGFRAGGYTLAFALFLASAARALLPAEYCLGLLVRSRRLDAATTLLLGVAVAVVAAIVPPG